MPVTDLALLTAVAKTSGEIARGFVDADPQVWEKDDGAGPVTEADLAVNEVMAQQLLGARSD